MKQLRTCPICGAEFWAKVSPSRVGRGIYCGVKCRGGNNKLSHGHTLGGQHSQTYSTWVNMVRRCTDPGHDKFPRYGAVGITVCDQWRKFDNFLKDMGERPAGCTIDRIDGAKGYEPGNCRWANIKEQQRNTKSNVFIEYQGQRRCISEWAEICDIDKTQLGWRIRKGWSAEEALTTRPSRSNRIKRLHTSPSLPPCV